MSEPARGPSMGGVGNRHAGAPGKGGQAVFSPRLESCIVFHVGGDHPSPPGRETRHPNSLTAAGSFFQFSLSQALDLITAYHFFFSFLSLPDPEASTLLAYEAPACRRHGRSGRIPIERSCLGFFITAFHADRAR